jgi:hypothetical protein
MLTVETSWSLGSGERIICHPQIVEDASGITGALGDGGGDAIAALRLGQAGREAKQPCDVLRTVVGAQGAAVFLPFSVENFERTGQAFALESQRPAPHVLKDGAYRQHDPFPAQQIHQLAQYVHWPAGDARGLPSVRLEHDPFVQRKIDSETLYRCSAAVAERSANSGFVSR